MPARFLVFDCDGVLADTERAGHLPAFNRTFAEFGVPVEWSDADYAEKVKIGGGKERMRSELTADLLAAAGLPDDEDGRSALVARWHARKTEIYTAMVAAGELPARPGIRRLAAEADAAGWRLAVASTSAEPSVRAVLGHAVGDELAARFAVFAGDIVPRKKPAPDIYLLALDRLGASPDEVVVVEDSGGGLAASATAGLRTVVTISAYTAGDDFSAASLVVDSLGEQGHPARVEADPFGLHPGELVDVAVLEAVLAAPGPATGSGPPPGSHRASEPGRGSEPGRASETTSVKE